MKASAKERRRQRKAAKALIKTLSEAQDWVPKRPPSVYDFRKFLTPENTQVWPI
jgi:hypothetical protein